METKRAQEIVEYFEYWYRHHGHWIYASREQAIAQWVKSGIEGLPNAPKGVR